MEVVQWWSKVTKNRIAALYLDSFKRNQTCVDHFMPAVKAGVGVGTVGRVRYEGASKAIHSSFILLLVALGSGNV